MAHVTERRFSTALRPSTSSEEGRGPTMNDTPATQAYCALPHVPPRRGSARERGRPDHGGAVNADLLDRVPTPES